MLTIPFPSVVVVVANEPWCHHVIAVQVVVAVRVVVIKLLSVVSHDVQKEQISCDGIQVGRHRKADIEKRRSAQYTGKF
jgi:hypothetical protein